MSDNPIAERTRTVYGKDLHDDFFSVNVRIDSDSIEPGDTIHVQVDNISNRDTEQADSEPEEER